MNESRTEREDAVDALVESVRPDVAAGPVVQTRDVILVTGPWLAGSTSLADALRQRLSDRTFVEAADLDDGDAPAAVVFVTSAVGAAHRIGLRAARLGRCQYRPGDRRGVENRCTPGLA